MHFVREGTPLPCTTMTNAVLILAHTETHPHSNDPSEAIRVLAPLKRLMRRLAGGVVFLAVSAETFIPSHRAWCERLHAQTSFRVACHLLLSDNSTASAALAALKGHSPCLAAALVVEDPAAVDGGLAHRLAAVPTGRYACLAALRREKTCPVYVVPIK